MSGDEFYDDDVTSGVQVAVRDASTPEAEFAWLIERGQPEKQIPTVWWENRDRWGLTYMDRWTEDANEASRFESREAAEEVIASKFTPPPSRGGPSARAVEHGFLGTASEQPMSGLLEAVERIRAHHDRTLGHRRTNRVGYCAEPDGISATYCETGILLAAIP